MSWSVYELQADRRSTEELALNGSENYTKHEWESHGTKLEACYG